MACVGTCSRLGRRNTTNYRPWCWASSLGFTRERQGAWCFLVTQGFLRPWPRRNTLTSLLESAWHTPRITRGLVGQDLWQPRDDQRTRRIRPVLYRLRRPVGRHHECQPSLWLRLYQSGAPSILQSLRHCGEWAERRSAVSRTYPGLWGLS